MKSKLVQRVLRGLITLLGAGIGLGLALLALQIIEFYNPDHIVQITTLFLIYASFAIVFGLIFFGISPIIIKRTADLGNSIERYMDSMPLHQVITSTLGLIMGLVIAALITQMFQFVGSSVFTTALSAIIYVVFGSVGLTIGRKRGKEVPMLPGEEGATKERRFFRSLSSKGIPPKILDSSVIIDGRVFDVYRAGFLEGEMIVPQFILDELRHVADSSDLLRRSRGRRGLEILSKMQNELKLPLKIDETDFEDVVEADVKLLRLSRQLGGTVVTNDYNLNKVADVTGVKVLNINELVNAIKPVVLPGEEMHVQVVREGKEPGQGVAYLEDGTMIVVENARRHVGETLEIVVTTVLQTSAGRMIFARLKTDA